jgi:hypothetical protein
MGLYAMGKTAAIAAIKAAVNARISTLSDGSLSLDAGSLQKWLADQADIIIASDVLPANVEAAKGVLATINTNPDNAALASYINSANWKNRPDWPTNLSVSTNQGFISSVATAIQEMIASANTVEQYYVDQKAALPVHFDNLYDELAISAKLPPTVDRIVDSRYYVYTYVTDRGEESAPSPVSDLVECDQNDTVGISITAAPSGRYIAKWRFYRSNTGSNDAAFQFLDEGVIATLTGTDTAKSSDLQEVIPSLTWAEPPANLQGLTGMPNGVMAGFFGNTVAFCEPYIPYAWPVGYQVSTEHPIVAMAAFGQTLVVGTRGSPYYISGADSASMSAVKMDSRQSCVSARSMISVDGGVIYASPDGLCFASGQGIRVVTEGIVSREDWQALVPSSMFCAFHDGVLYVHTAANVTYALHLANGKLSTVSLGAPTTLYVDNVTDKLYAASGTNIVSVATASGRRTATWKSKRFVLPRPAPFAWLVIESDFSSALTVNWYGDGVLRHTATVSSRLPVRLPAGEFLEHELEISGTATWNSLTIASSTAELQAVPS